MSKVVVALRIRSTLSTDKGDEQLTFQTTGPGGITILDSKGEARDFQYNYAFQGDSQQEDIYSCVGQPVVENVIEGFNACVFAYGQTGSGKTYTMIGAEDQEGLVPRISRDLISRVETLETCDPSACTFTVSYVEVYMEKLRDLLIEASGTGGGGNVAVREHPKLGTYVDGATQVVINTHKEVMELVEIGSRQRTTTGTAMNAVSSRSHAIFTIVVEQGAEQEEMTNGKGQMDEKIGKVSRLNLIDLAGSESSKTANSSGKTLKEGASINKSLMTLGRVIKALVAVKGKNNKKSTRIPYRDSVLTFLLKDSLGGNAKTTMVATIRPEAAFISETLSTLRYAQTAKLVVNNAVINEHPLQKKVKELEAVIQALLRQIGTTSNGQGTGISASDIEGLKQMMLDQNMMPSLVTKTPLPENSNSIPAVPRELESERKQQENIGEGSELRRQLAQTKEELDIERAMIIKERNDNMLLREELRMKEEQERMREEDLIARTERVRLLQQKRPLQDQSHITASILERFNESDSVAESLGGDMVTPPPIPALYSDGNSQDTVQLPPTDKLSYHADGCQLETIDDSESRKHGQENSENPEKCSLQNASPNKLEAEKTDSLINNRNHCDIREDSMLHITYPNSKDQVGNATITSHLVSLSPLERSSTRELILSPKTTMRITKAGSEAIGSEYHITRIRNLKKNISGLREKLDRTEHMKRSSRYSRGGNSPSSPTTPFIPPVSSQTRASTMEASRKALQDRLDVNEKQIKQSRERADAMRETNQKAQQSLPQEHGHLSKLRHKRAPKEGIGSWMIKKMDTP